MDLFAFASKSETQGLVLIEAMAAGVPVVGLDASGVREVIRDGHNGRLIMAERVQPFAKALTELARQSRRAHHAMRAAARRTAEEFSMPRCAERALKLYAELQARKPRRQRDERLWIRAARRVQAEWAIMKKTAKATRALVESAPKGEATEVSTHH